MQASFMPWNTRSRGFLILHAGEPQAMNASSMRKWLPALVACVLVVGIFTPVVALGQANSSRQQSQLSVLVAAADSSRSYATSTVDYASASGLSVAAAQAQLSQGDSLLATAQSDLQAGSNLADGLNAVQAALSDYASASASASVALSSAGLAAIVDYHAAVSAVAEVNATAEVAASVAAQACAGAAASSSGSQAFAQACAQVSANVASARTHLGEAASLLSESSGQAAATANVTQALSLAAQARADVQACQALILTMASYTYSQRGQAYILAVIDPLGISANATVQAEQTLITRLATYQMNWTDYARSQASTTANVGSSASGLEAAISQVDASSVSPIISGALSTSGQVSNEMSALLSVSGIIALPGVVADINACVSSTDSYAAALGNAQTWNSAYAQASLSGFAAYLSTGTTDASTLQQSGSAYVTAFNKVVADLSSLLGIPGVQAIYNVLVGLSVSGGVGGVNASLQQETGAMGAVLTEISSLSTAVSSGKANILVGSNLLATAASFSSEGTAYLNATATASIGQINASARSTSEAAQSYVAGATAMLQTSIGTYSNSAATLASSGASLKSQTQAAASATVSAGSYVQSDSRVRSSEIVGGRADATQALQLFSSQNVPAGVATMARAYVEFQSASAVST